MSQVPVNKEKAGEDWPVAYSYVRFSTAKQELGDSLRRQVEMARAYCAKHDLHLHEESYRDLGVSAFKRRNVEKGALASFIEAVKSGKVSKGSYLVVEQFDRLSRADIDVAVRLLLELVHADIRVVTLVDEKVWDRDSVKDIGNLILAIVWMSRANNESAMKAERLSAVWGAKKKAAAEGTAKRIVTSECPRWLRPNADKTGFEVLDDRVGSIKRVFELRIGGRGVVSIVSQANKEGWPVPGKGDTWHTSLVGRILRNRALLGEYLPHVNTDDGKRQPSGAPPVRGYYPAVIDETTFLRAQAVADRRGKFPGRRDPSYKNWLQGLLRCGKCGSSMVRKNKDSKAQPEYARYYCSKRNRGVTMCAGANAKELEGAVIYVVSAVAPQFFDGSQRMEEVKAACDVLEVELKAATDRVERFVEAIGDGAAAPRSLAPKLRAAEAEVHEVEGRLRALRAERADLEGDFDSVFANIARQVQGLTTLDARAQLREELSRVIKHVEVHEPEGYIVVHLRTNSYPAVHALRPDVQLPDGFQAFQASNEVEGYA